MTHPLLFLQTWSDRRGSNPRPAAWEAAALPTELLSLERSLQIDNSNCAALLCEARIYFCFLMWCRLFLDALEAYLCGFVGGNAFVHTVAGRVVEVVVFGTVAGYMLVDELFDVELSA